MKNRILIITPFLMQGGVEHSLITALSGIDYEKNDVTLYLYKEDLTLLPKVPEQVKVIKGFDKTHYYRKVYTAGLSAVSFIAKKLKFKKLEQKAQLLCSSYIHKKKVRYPFVNFFKNEKFDVVISYCLHIGTEMALKIDADKHYLFLHNSHTDYHMDIFEKCVDDYDALIAVSDGVQQVYSEDYPKCADKISVIDNYVDASEIVCKSKEYTLQKEKNDKYVFCTCGRLAIEKGFDLAIEAAHILKKKGYSFTWYFVGDGYHKSELEHMIKEYGLESEIEITGLLENPYPYFRHCDIYIQPSYEESQGLAMYEALVLGRAVVSTNTVGGICTLENGKKGVLVPITAEGIAQGISEVIHNGIEKYHIDYQIISEKNLKDKNIYYDKWNNVLNGSL